jgi:hypothetical protein
MKNYARKLHIRMASQEGLADVYSIQHIPDDTPAGIVPIVVRLRGDAAHDEILAVVDLIVHCHSSRTWNVEALDDRKTPVHCSSQRQKLECPRSELRASSHGVYLKCKCLRPSESNAQLPSLRMFAREVVFCRMRQMRLQICLELRFENPNESDAIPGNDTHSDIHREDANNETVLPQRGPHDANGGAPRPVDRLEEKPPQLPDPDPHETFEPDLPDEAEPEQLAIARDTELIS